MFAADSLTSVVAHLNEVHRIEPHPPIDADGQLQTAEAKIDFGDVPGQETVQRALAIAAAGGHNVLTFGAIHPGGS